MAQPLAKWSCPAGDAIMLLQSLTTHPSHRHDKMSRFERDGFAFSS